jgi:hypothetical protein
MQAGQPQDCLILVFSLVRNRFLPGNWASTLSAQMMLIKMSFSSVALTGTAPLLASAAMSRIFGGMKLFRKGSLAERPVLGSSFPMRSSLRLTDQQIYLFFQKAQLLLHLFEQGKHIIFRSVRNFRRGNARFFVHFDCLPFIELWDRVIEARIFSMSNLVRITA